MEQTGLLQKNGDKEEREGVPGLCVLNLKTRRKRLTTFSTQTVFTSRNISSSLE